MAKTSNKQYAEALYEVTQDLKGSDLSDAIKTFVEILVRDHKLKQGYNIIAEFERTVKKASGVVELEITSARELDKKIVEEIKQTFGKNVEAVTQVDESIIGGIKVKLEDKILDGSVKTQLKSLKQQLSN
ncbi:ATP synthase F1 subunit delta [Candidatus Parcubacteria bacterium]|jgi:F-type H+-transporting ATPase subunit delta|nr:ATP synthase F1 subunit delta [Candidatus Parcubacteria bacterium]MBT3948840.1 ATP synthase F1 subunit delta [Candidatus Parcubacteria bacterium]